MGTVWPVIWGIGCKETILDSSSPLLTFRECSIAVNLIQTLTLNLMIKIQYAEQVFTIMTRAISHLLTKLKKLFYLHWMCRTALVNASCILWANWWALLWLCVTGTVVLDINSGTPASPGGVYIWNPLIQTAFHLICGEVQCVSINSGGLPRSFLPPATV